MVLGPRPLRRGWPACEPGFKHQLPRKGALRVLTSLPFKTLSQVVNGVHMCWCPPALTLPTRPPRTGIRLCCTKCPPETLLTESFLRDSVSEAPFLSGLGLSQVI